MASTKRPRAGELPADAPRRRRRSPEEARSEILGAAAEQLAAGPVEALTVSAVMARTTLSRKAFYVYFRDRSELILGLVRPLRAEADAALERWAGHSDPVAAGREALLAAARMYREHGEVLRALVGAPSSDPELAAARAALAEGLVAVGEAQIRRADTGIAEPRATAQALATMNIHVLLQAAPGASDAELDRLVATLSEIWERTLFGVPGA